MMSNMAHITVEYGRSSNKLHIEKHVAERGLKDFECLLWRCQFMKKKKQAECFIFCVSSRSILHRLHRAGWERIDGGYADLIFMDCIHKLPWRAHLLCLAKVGYRQEEKGGTGHS